MEPETAELCTFCAGLIPLKEESTPIRAHYANIGLLEQSSKRCMMCTVLLGDWCLEKLQRQFQDIERGEYESIGMEVELKEIQHWDSGISWAIIEAHFKTRGFSFYDSFSVTTCNPKSTSAALSIWRTATTSTRDKVSTLKSWLHDCELTHPKCRPLASQMPKRLIDVGTPGTQHPRLVMSEDLHGQDIRYAALSYRWGNTKFRTTKENETSYKQEIPFEPLPSVLQDALELTRELHIRFLWIDALCIVQDDLAEWTVEAARMQDIYSGSAITLAATDAADSALGLFSSNSSAVCNPDKKGAFVTVSNVGDALGTIVRVQPRDIRASAEESVLNTRGWVLQEMVLSHRTVHCMRSGLYWECRSESRTETGVVFDRAAMHHSSMPILPHSIQTGVNKTWWKWMESYSRRSFTVPTDRLPAMSGIVRHYQMATKDVPILGLWESTLHQDLLWMRIDKVSDEADPTPNHLSNIPSWTWLSCPHDISFDFWKASQDEDMHPVTHDHLNLVDWAVNWTAKPFVSDVKSTRLLVNEPVRDIVLSIAPKGKDFNPPYLDADNEKPDFDSNPFPWRYAGQFDVKRPTSPTRYPCLLVRSRVYTDEESMKYKAAIRETFLILEACSGSDSYRRVGIGNFIGESSDFDLTNRRTLSLA